MLKLRNLVDHTKFKRGEEVRKLPTKIQKGVVIEGDGFELKKLKRGKRHNNVVDYFLQMDKEMGYSTRKFSEVQRVKQRRKRIKKKDVRARKKQSQYWNFMMRPHGYFVICLNFPNKYTEFEACIDYWRIVLPSLAGDLNYKIKTYLHAD